MAVHWPLVGSLIPERHDSGFGHSLMMAISRPWAFSRWFAHLRTLQLPQSLEVVALVDHADPKFYDRVREALLGLGHPLVIHWTRRPPAGEWDQVARRVRIVENWLQLLSMAGGEILLGLEDDTLPDVDAYPTLVAHLKAGHIFAQATTVGRWQAGLIPHWTCEVDSSGNPVTWLSGTWCNSDVQPISGGGWYCYAARSGAIRAIEMRLPVGDPMGPDVWAVHRLSKSGSCVGDWRVQAIHMAATMDLSPNRHVVDRVCIRFEQGRWRNSIEAGRGLVLPDRLVDTNGSQPVPVGPRRPPRQVRMRANAAGEWQAEVVTLRP